MMAFGHASSAWLAALMTINALSLFHSDDPNVTAAASALVLSLLTALAAAGSGCVPDLDHKSSTITTAFGPLSYYAHVGVVGLHHTVCAFTADGAGRKYPGAHRGVTHWWPFPLALGGLVAWGCHTSKWVTFGVLIVLFTTALRALTVPGYQARESHTVRRRWSMKTAHRILEFVPIMFVLKRARRLVNRRSRIGFKLLHVTIAAGKIGTVVIAVNLALIAMSHHADDYGVGLGVLVCAGSYIHILGDAPTEAGIPGFRITRSWRLPKWLAFKAGGPFEMIGLWIPMVILGVYLIPGLRPHTEQLAVQGWVLKGLGVVITGVIVAHTLDRTLRRLRRY